MSCPHKHQQQVSQIQKALHPFFGRFSECKNSNIVREQGYGTYNNNNVNNFDGEKNKE